MTFSEYALALSPYISDGKKTAEYFTELIGNYIKDAAMDSCELLNCKIDTQYRYIKGTRPITKKNAQYLYDHRDEDKFSNWIADRIDVTDSFDAIEEFLKKNDRVYDLVFNGCFELLEEILLDIINPKDICTAISRYIPLYKSNILQSELPTEQTKQLITDYVKSNIGSYQTIDPSMCKNPLENDHIYSLTTEFGFEERYIEGKRTIILTATWNNISITGKTSITNWISESYMNNCADAGKKNVTAIFKVLNNENNTVQYLLVFDVR